MSRASEQLQAGGRRVPLGRAGKVLFPETGATKRDLAGHYLRAAPRMVPLLRGHPLALHRFPDGVAEDGFFQKQVPRHAPEWLPRVSVPRETGGRVVMLAGDGAAPLVWAAGQGAVELHLLLSTRHALRSPDRMVFDLDPAVDDFAEVKRVAVALRGLLEDELELPAYPMTTGSRGLHVVVPLRRGHDFDEVKDLASRTAGLLADRDPDRLTTAFRKAERGKRLFLDVLRNQYAQHAVAPYSVRALPEAPVAVPVAWAELDTLGSARHWTLATVAERLAGPDPWAGMRRRAHGLGPARRRLAGLVD